MYYLPYDYSCNIDQTGAFAGVSKDFIYVETLFEYLVEKLKLKSIFEPFHDKSKIMTFTCIFKTQIHLDTCTV